MNSDFNVPSDILYIFKSEVDDYSSFKDLVKLYNCTIFSEDIVYYMINGNPNDIQELKAFWISAL